MTKVGRTSLSAIAAAGCALMLGGCGSDPKLSALQGDPMATATFVHTTLDRESTQKSGTSLGKPVYAQVLRAFTLHGTSAQSVFDESVTTAQEKGWKQTFRQGTGYIGRKSIGDVDASLSIHAGPPGGASSLVVILTAR